MTPIERRAELLAIRERSCFDGVRLGAEDRRTLLALVREMRAVLAYFESHDPQVDQKIADLLAATGGGVSDE